MRALLLALVVAAPALAGCVDLPAETLSADALPATAPALDAVAHTAGGVVVPLLDGALRALGGAYYLGAAAVEPTVGVDADGSVYMTAIDFTDAPDPLGYLIRPVVMRSDDQGLTWTTTGALAHATTLDPYVYVDVDTGRVFQDDILPLGCGMLSFSDDKGATWTTNPLACGNPQVNDHQTLVTAKPRTLATVGYPNLVYRCVNNVAYPACAVSVNGGVTFGPQRPIVEELGIDLDYEMFFGLPVCSSLTSHLKASPDGVVYLPLSDCTIAASPPIVAVTKDDGLTWQVNTISEEHLADTHEVAVAVDDAGNVFALWASGGRLMLATSADEGATWSDAIDVTAPGVTAVEFPAMAAGAEGRIAFAYIGTDFPDGYEGKDEAEDWDGAVWHAYLAVVTDALAADPVVQTVTVNDPADPVARNQCGGTRCRGMTDFHEIVIDLEGRPWTSFVDVCAEGCADDPEDGSNAGFVGTLRAGPALRGELVALPLLPVQG